MVKDEYIRGNISQVLYRFVVDVLVSKIEP